MKVDNINLIISKNVSFKTIPRPNFETEVIKDIFYLSNRLKKWYLDQVKVFIAVLILINKIMIHYSFLSTDFLAKKNTKLSQTK